MFWSVEECAAGVAAFVAVHTNEPSDRWLTDVSTTFAMEQIKFTIAIPLDFLGDRAG